MFLRSHSRSKDGKAHVPWSLVETVRTPDGPRRKTICYLGELKSSAEARWLKTVEVFNEQREARQLEDGNLRAIAGPSLVQLHTNASWTIEKGRIVSAFTLAEGAERHFTLTYRPSHLPLPEPVQAEAALEATLVFWEEWSGRCSVQGSCRETVLRSLITLKALTYRPTGGIVAALTTSLPERLGGERNWNYRFCWLRDATFTLLSLMNCGYLDEAAAWRACLIRAAAGDPAQLQIMYGLGGERNLFERTLDRLPGFEQSAPVQTGNAAVDQLQLDVFGDVRARA